MEEFIDITPATNILEMLGQIQFSSTQCLCELIDNSLDAFDDDEPSKILELDSETGIKVSSKKTIIIKIPKFKKNSLKPDKYDLEGKCISVEDNGKGMDRQELRNSLKAGFSGKNKVDKLGLFGMGFNIATARLGKKTEITTCKKSDTFKYQVTIDFKELRKLGRFEAPIKTIPKDIDEHDKEGTTIKIYNLDEDQVKSLRRKSDRLKEIEKTYGKILREKGFQIIYDGVKCKPFAHCVWGPTRRGRDGVRAYMHINEVIDEKRYCTLCWNWLNDSEFNCSSCGTNENLVKRERKVKGWIGIQRFFDETHYGIDLIRNGRVIKHLYKGLFSWTHPATGAVVKEYPVDGQGGKGRIIGELEIDFVQVKYTKDAFVEESNDWRDFILTIRDKGPLGKGQADKFNQAINYSHLAKLYKAFRYSTKGRLNLIPIKQNGSAMISDSKIYDLRDKFFDREEGYIDDSKWWELIEQGEENLNNSSGQNSSEPDQSGGSFFNNNENNQNPDFRDEITETITNKIEEEFEIDENLTRAYTIDLFKKVTISVKAFRAKKGLNSKGFSVKLDGFSVIFKYWPNSKIFQETFLKPEDLLINELAYSFFINGGEENLAEYPLSLAERSIRKAYFPDLLPEISQIDEQIENLTREIKEHMRGSIKKLSNFKFNELSNKSRSKIRRRMFQGETLSPQEMENAQKKGEFLTYADLSVLVEIFNKYPSTLLDGEFFRYKVNTQNKFDLPEKEFIKDTSVIFWDIVWWKDKGTPSSSEVWKGRSRRVIGSLEVIRGWRND